MVKIKSFVKSCVFPETATSTTSCKTSEIPAEPKEEHVPRSNATIKTPLFRLQYFFISHPPLIYFMFITYHIILFLSNLFYVYQILGFPTMADAMEPILPINPIPSYETQRNLFHFHKEML